MSTLEEEPVVEKQEAAVDEVPVESADESIEKEETEVEEIETVQETPEPVRDQEIAPVQKLLNLSNQRQALQ